jgi:hypothetical protein
LLEERSGIEGACVTASYGVQVMIPAAPFPEAVAHTMSLIASKLQQPFFRSALGNSIHAALRIQLIQQGRVWRSTNSKAILITAIWQMMQPGENVNQLLKMPEILAAAREKWVVIELKTLQLLLFSITAGENNLGSAYGIIRP